MKIYEFALIVLLFSGVVTLFNSLGIFDHNLNKLDYNITESQADGIYQVGSDSEIGSKDSWYDRIESGIDFVMKLMGLASNALSLGLNIGGIFYTYIPNQVGLAINILITGISYFVYMWGGFQIWRRFSSKGAD